MNADLIAESMFDRIRDATRRLSPTDRFHYCTLLIDRLITLKDLSERQCAIALEEEEE